MPDYGSDEVADHAVAMIVSLQRRLPQFDAAVREGRWGAKQLIPELPAFSDTNVGLLGFGKIARAVAARLLPSGFNLTACDPRATPDTATAAQVRLVDFDELVGVSDVLSLHIPLTSSTRHVIDAPTLSSMPRGAAVVNVSRGGLIDESALAAALQSGHISSAGIDVFEIEPIELGSPLLKAPNTIFSPHAAYYSTKSLDSLQRLAAEEASRFLRGAPLRCALN